MNKKNLRIAEELIEAAANLIFADNDYIYDPEHKKHPSGGYHKTEKGWSKAEEKKEKSTSTKNDEMDSREKRLDKLSNGNVYDRISVSYALAAHPSTLDKLSKDKDDGVRLNVAGNPRTSPKTLDKLSKDKEWDVRINVAENPNTSPKTLDKMADDKDYRVQLAVINNKNTSKDTLKKLSKHKSLSTRLLAIEKLSNI